MQVNRDSRIAIAERVLTLIALKRRSIISIGEISLISAGRQNVFGFWQVGLMNEYVQIREFSKRYVAVHGMCENWPLEHRNRNGILLEERQQTQKLTGEKQIFL